MVSLRSFTAALTALSTLMMTQAAPLADRLMLLSPSARDVLKRSVPAAPRFVVYNDRWINPFPPPSSIQGFNVFAITFLLASGSVDQAQNWEELEVSQRTAYIQEYSKAGISIIVSGFGSTETPTSSGTNAVAAANSMANWVTQYGVQGIDVDYEDFMAFNSGNGAAENWLIAYTQQLRKNLPHGEYIISHAPVAPWFSPKMWSGGGYLAVDRAVGSLIDWYNVQFYNQGTSEYTTCSGLLSASSSAWPQSALFQIAANGVDKNKLLIGKPATSADANNGYIAPSALASCVAQAASSGWDAGVMAWQYPDATSQWITTVRGSTWPVPNAPPPPPPSKTTSVGLPPSPTSTGTPGRGSCAGVSTWSAGVAYSNGSKVTYNGALWIADQWNESEQPGSSSGAWVNNGACS